MKPPWGSVKKPSGDGGLHPLCWGWFWIVLWVHWRADFELFCFIQRKDQQGNMFRNDWHAPSQHSFVDLTSPKIPMPKEKRLWTLWLDATWDHFNHNCFFFDSCHKCYESWQICRNIHGGPTTAFGRVRPTVRKFVNPERNGWVRPGVMKLPFFGGDPTRAKFWGISPSALFGLAM